MKIKFSLKLKINNEKTVEQAKMVLFDSMMKMHELANINCPVDTSRLKTSIKVFPTSPGFTKYILIAPVEYAEDVEFGCFFKDTILIKTNKGNKKLKDLKLGDLIWTGKDYKKLIQKEKLEIGYPVKKIIIKTKNKKLEVTEDHPIWTNKGWKKARELKQEDKIKKIW